jgi:hypothetical protein
MTAPLPPTPAPEADDAPDAVVLRQSVQLGTVPAPAASRPLEKTVGGAATTDLGAPDSFAGHFARALNDSPAWVLLGLAALASAGWVVERRRRRELETEKDSVLWADVQPPGTSIVTNLDALFQEELADHDGDGLATAPPQSTTIASRREATLIDLHQLDSKLRRRRIRGDLLSATLLLQQHLADFRYTSPWVFLELRELHHLLGREQEWELAREAFRARFAQRAPVWQAPSTAHVQLADDDAICGEVAAQWPYREARMVVRRWVLGEGESAQGQGPVPILALGVYRDLLFLDRLLDRIMLTRPPIEDSLL